MLYNNATYEYTLRNKSYSNPDIFDLGYDIITEYINNISSNNNNIIRGDYQMNTIVSRLTKFAYFYYNGDREKQTQMRKSYYLMKDKIAAYVNANIKDSAKKNTILTKLIKLYSQS